MKKSLIAKIVGLGGSVLALLIMLVTKVTFKVSATVAGMSQSMDQKFKFMDVITNKENAFDDMTCRTIVLFAFILVILAVLYFAASVVLEVMGKKLPVAQADLIGAGVIVFAAVLLVLAQFFAEKESEGGYTLKVAIQTLSYIGTYVTLLAGVGAGAAAVVLKD